MCDQASIICPRCGSIRVNRTGKLLYNKLYHGGSYTAVFELFLWCGCGYEELVGESTQMITNPSFLAWLSANSGRIAKALAFYDQHQGGK
jgi:hypothetical protein